MKTRFNNYEQWLRTLKEQFGGNIPVASYWYNPDDIRQIIQHFGAEDNLVCAILPGGGWYDLKGANPSVEPGLIELHFGGATYVSKPHSLWFLGLGDENGEQWSYFHLHAHELMPIRPDELSHTEYFQRLTELSPGDYASPHLWETRSGYEQPKLPVTARAITHWLKGSMVLAWKFGPYFQDNTAKLGEHSLMTPAQFRLLMELMRDKHNSKR